MLTLNDVPMLGGLGLELALGRIARVEPDGTAWVVQGAENATPQRAQSAVAIAPERAVERIGATVLLAIGRDPGARPVIVGFVSETLAPVPVAPTVPRRKRQVLVDGERVVFDATREIVLRCGRASITLTAQGEIQIRGARVVNHSSGSQVLRGATVRIN